jgi:hypothetical protein
MNAGNAQGQFSTGGASGRRGTIYIGSSSNLMQRLHQHREGLIPGFTRRYGVSRLVHFEMFERLSPVSGSSRNGGGRGRSS